VRKQYPGANTISFSACLPTHVEAVFKQAGYLAREEEAVFGVANDEVQLQQFAERAFMTRFDKDA
jgi:hypothetical protein